MIDRIRLKTMAPNSSIEEKEVKAQAAGRNKVMYNQRCQDCGQYKRACNGEHVQMVVGPKNPRRWASFPGMMTNGVFYRSNGPNHLKTVPKENDLAHRISVWENSEEDLRQGRELTHYSGHITRGGGGVAANPIGFSGLAPSER